MQEAVLAEARSILAEIDCEEIADEVFFALDSTDVEGCWDRSSRDGYTAPEEAAVEIMEALQPFSEQGKRYSCAGHARSRDDLLHGRDFGNLSLGASIRFRIQGMGHRPSYRMCGRFAGGMAEASPRNNFR